MKKLTDIPASDLNKTVEALSDAGLNEGNAAWVRASLANSQFVVSMIRKQQLKAYQEEIAPQLSDLREDNIKEGWQIPESIFQSITEQPIGLLELDDKFVSISLGATDGLTWSFYFYNWRIVKILRNRETLDSEFLRREAAELLNRHGIKVPITL